MVIARIDAFFGVAVVILSIARVGNAAAFSTLHSHATTNSLPVASRRILGGARQHHDALVGKELPRPSFVLFATAFRDMDDDVIVDEEGEVIHIPRKRIQRTWTFEGFESYGEMRVDLFLPGGDNKPKGCVFFMHGFSQYPHAYHKTLKRVTDEADVAIIAVETGLTSKIAFDIKDSQFSLQRAVSQDTVQLIQMVLDGEEPFKSLGIDKDIPLGLCGHSMGGGLCFPVAAEFPNINYVFAMAPFGGVPQFDPISAIKKGSADNLIVLAGRYDLIAGAGKVEAISAASNDHNAESSLYGVINRGLHTGFQDKVVAFRVPLQFLVVAFSYVLSLLEVILSLLFAWKNKAQLEASRQLMVYFFTQMVNNKEVTLEDAEEALEKMPEKWEDLVSFKYA